MEAYWKKLVTMVRYASRLRIPVYAAHASFFIALAVFPSLVLFVGLLRYTGVEVEYLTELLTFCCRPFPFRREERLLWISAPE